MFVPGQPHAIPVHCSLLSASQTARTWWCVIHSPFTGVKKRVLRVGHRYTANTKEWCVHGRTQRWFPMPVCDLVKCCFFRSWSDTIMEGHMCDFVVRLLYVSFWVTPSWKVTCMNMVPWTPVFHLSCLMWMVGGEVRWGEVRCGGVGLPSTPRVSIQNASVCTFKTSPWEPAPRAHVSTHVLVVPVHTGTFWTYTGYRGVEIMDASEKLSSENQCERSTDITKEREEFILPVADGTAKLSGRDCEIPSTHSKAGRTCKEWRPQWTTSRRTWTASTDRIKRWRWSPCRLLVDARWLHLSSSQWTSSSTLCAEGRTHSQFHWNTLIWPGLLIMIFTSCKRSVLMTAGMSIRAEVC